MLSFQRVLCVLVVVAGVGCGGDDSASTDAGMDANAGSGGSAGIGGTSGTGGTGGVGGDDQDAMVVDDAALDASACQAPLTATHDSLGGSHVANNDGVTYNSNPPSSGPHCGVWGQYAIYGASKPLPRCNYIHNLEHGAVVVLYRCDGECPEVVEALTNVRDAIVDPECPSGKRVILTPDANLDTLIAAAAWRNTWQSDCINEDALSSLATFITGHLGGAGVAPESNICGNGSVSP